MENFDEATQKIIDDALQDSNDIEQQQPQSKNSPKNDDDELTDFEREFKEQMDEADTSFVSETLEW